MEKINQLMQEWKRGTIQLSTELKRKGYKKRSIKEIPSKQMARIIGLWSL